MMYHPDTPYILDPYGQIWRVVRDGGMATRADYNGIVTIGIEALRREAGPLIHFTAGQVADWTGAQSGRGGPDDRRCGYVNSRHGRCVLPSEHRGVHEGDAEWRLME